MAATLTGSCCWSRPSWVAPLACPCPRELVFVIDSSGSMSGASIEQAKAALLFGLRGLHPADRFNLVEFDSVTRVLAPAPLPATPENLDQAVRFVAGLRADGGTELAAALRTVLDGKTGTERLRQVVFLTDGSVGNEHELFDIIGRDLGDARLFTVGIGAAPNSHFMAEAASLGRGTFTYIGAVNEVEERMRDLLSKLEYPVLADIRLAWADAGAGPGSDAAELDYSPKPLRDLYAQEPLVVSFRVHGSVKPHGWDLALPQPRAVLPQTATPAGLLLRLGAALLLLALALGAWAQRVRGA